ncbi:MAG: UDP-N-acetylmuramoyl-tripeptide--D-alanyl-D-alanine ligase [Acidobacteria bacterium]|nr:UDP-N-acetylmuramoyl-tripeptide--D-alanyl-D-alanine ligase [Acidobacteriota bacterium]MBI3657797.1 UDP-N-acetylmuramoyl-tripeptide--D-alanyl-D-alanine ligase [Acidobacteriota bacterium]
MSGLSFKEIIEATGGRLLAGSAEGDAPSLSIDSRTLNAGDLFFAISGPHFDGHSFVEEALNRGACGAVVSQDHSQFRGLTGATIIQVADTTRALQEVGALARARWRRPVVAVTGSMGKTTTKDMIAKVLEGVGSVLKSQGNLNNQFGLPLTLYQLDASHDLAVVEMGMNHPGELVRLCEIAEPSVGVYTNVAPVHLENFSSVEAIAAAKAELAHYMDSRGTVIYNMDDPYVERIGRSFRGATLSYGVDSAAEVTAHDIVAGGLSTTRFTACYRDQAQEVTIAMIGKHNVYNALAAIATGVHFGLNLSLIARQMATLCPSARRGEVLHFIEGFTLIDDSYNSNPQALREMITTFSQITGYRRRMVAVGAMLELGPQSGELHRECGRFIARAPVDELLCVGEESRRLGEGAMAEGLSPSHVHFFPDAVSAGAFLCTLAGHGDLLLVKGSRGIRMDRAVAKIKETFKLRGD